MRSMKNDVRNPLIDCSALESANIKGIPQSLIRYANFGSFGMTGSTKYFLPEVQV